MVYSITLIIVTALPLPATTWQLDNSVAACHCALALCLALHFILYYFTTISTPFCARAHCCARQTRVYPVNDIQTAATDGVDVLNTRAVFARARTVITAATCHAALGTIRAFALCPLGACGRRRVCMTYTHAYRCRQW